MRCNRWRGARRYIARAEKNRGYALPAQAERKRATAFVTQLTHGEFSKCVGEVEVDGLSVSATLPKAKK
jgi:hypothetical protein